MPHHSSAKKHQLDAIVYALLRYVLGVFEDSGNCSTSLLVS
jgi:hypothetical protein